LTISAIITVVAQVIGLLGCYATTNSISVVKPSILKDELPGQ
jgi:hypothetical protein